MKGRGWDWFGSGEGQVTGCCECGYERSTSINIGNFFNSWETVSFSGGTLLFADSNDSNEPVTDQHGH